MNWIKQLPKLDLSANKYSQYGETEILKYIFNNIGRTNYFLVDIGAGGAGQNLSNSREFIENAWEGLLFDMDGSEGTIKEFVTPDNIVSILMKNECPVEFDFLSVDIDSFDYDVLDNILSHFRPRVICAEYNGTLDPSSKVKLAYEEGYTWDGTNKYGFSFMAGCDLLFKHGYAVVLCHKETNLFAVRRDLISPELYPAEIPLPKRNIYHAINPNANFIEI